MKASIISQIFLTIASANASNLRPRKFTVYIANTCDNEIGFTIDGHTENVAANKCQVFRGGYKHQDKIYFDETGSNEAGGMVSCAAVGDSNNDKCDLRGMAPDACVIPVELCKDKAAPTPAPAPAPTKKGYTVYVANKCASNGVQVKIGRQSKDIAADQCQAFSSDTYPDRTTFTEYGAGVIQSQLDCSGKGTANIDQCNLMGMAENACVLTTNNCVQTNPPVEKKYTLYVANKCANNSVNVKIGRQSKDIAANACQAYSSDSYPDLITYSEIGAGAVQNQLSCAGEGTDNIDQCNLMGMAENACVLTTSTCVP